MKEADFHSPAFDALEAVVTKGTVASHIFSDNIRMSLVKNIEEGFAYIDDLPTRKTLVAIVFGRVSCLNQLGAEGAKVYGRELGLDSIRILIELGNGNYLSLKERKQITHDTILNAIANQRLRTSFETPEEFLNYTVRFRKKLEEEKELH